MITSEVPISDDLQDEVGMMFYWAEGVIQLFIDALGDKGDKPFIPGGTMTHKDAALWQAHEWFKRYRIIDLLLETKK